MHAFGNFIESSESIRSLKIQGALGWRGEQMRSGLRAPISPPLRPRYSKSNWISTEKPKSHTASNMSKISSGLIIHSEWEVMVSSAPHTSLICYFAFLGLIKFSIDNLELVVLQWEALLYWWIFCEGMPNCGEGTKDCLHLKFKSWTVSYRRTEIYLLFFHPQVCSLRNVLVYSKHEHNVQS